MNRSPSPPPTDLSVIDSAPLTASDDADSPELNDLYEYIGFLTDQVGELEAENEKLKTKASIEDVRVRMMEPFAEKVFAFVAIYSICVLFLLIVSGDANSGFKLSDTILAIITGSTAVSVIGLIGMVVSGLFGNRN